MNNRDNHSSATASTATLSPDAERPAAPGHYLPLTQSPWRRALSPPRALPERWCRPDQLRGRIDAWRVWLATQPMGRWLVIEPDPRAFTAALLALWETGRSAVLPGDDRPQTLARLTPLVEGSLPATPPPPSQAPPPTPVPIDPEAEAVVLYTSGSTGKPVMQPKRFRQLESELDRQAELWPLEGAAVISQVSHQHIYGLLTGILRPLCHGVPFCGAENRYPEAMAERLAEASDAGLGARLVSSPAQLSRLPEHLSWPSAAMVFSSGAPLALRDAQRCEHLLGAPVIELYGSTETGGIAHRRQTLSEAWTPLPDVEIALGDGTLSLRSPFLASPQEWWQQADRVEPAANGFRLLGRSDRVAKIGGKRISLTATERYLRQYATIDDAHCLDLERRDGRLGVVVAMAAETLPHHHASRRALVTTLRDHLATLLEPVAIPRYWRFVQALPINSQGKRDHATLRRTFDDLDDDRLARWLGASVCDGKHVIALEVPERLRYLQGHFDQFPLVPGVVMIQWAIHHARETFTGLGAFRGVERLKFQKVLLPGQRLALTLEHRSDGIAFGFDSNLGRHASGRVRFVQEPRDA
ncbi:AMP-binding protein [Halomonas sp. V046]|uniref:AMP-binding protein n=1 Tax=Halomonas sp. V046 TaxID=3459611 RepID=UPI0040442523